MRQRAESWSAPHNKRKRIHFSLPSGRAKSNTFCFNNQSESRKFKSYWKVSGLVISEWQLVCKCTREKDVIITVFMARVGILADIDAKDMARKCFIPELTELFPGNIVTETVLLCTDFGRTVLFCGFIYWYRSNCYELIVVNPVKPLRRVSYSKKKLLSQLELGY